MIPDMMRLAKYLHIIRRVVASVSVNVVSMQSLLGLASGTFADIAFTDRVKPLALLD